MVKLTKLELGLVERYEDAFNEVDSRDFISLIKLFIDLEKGDYFINFRLLKKIIFTLVASRYPEELCLIIRHPDGYQGNRFWAGELVVNVEKFKQLQYEYTWEKNQYILYQIDFKLKDRTYEDVLNLPRDELTKRAMRSFREQCKENIPFNAHWENISDLMAETLKTVKIEVETT